MAKSSRRRLSRNEQGQTGCIWSLINIFDFRHGRTTRRLLSDGRRVNKDGVDDAYSSNQTIILDPTEKHESRMDAEESKVAVTDATKTSVKELMEEEMFNEQGSENLPNDFEMDLEQSNSKNRNRLKKYPKKRSRSRIKSNEVVSSEFVAAECLMPEISDPVPVQKPSENLDLQKIMEELAQIDQINTNCSKHDLDGDLDISSGQNFKVVEEKLVAAVKLFMEQRVSNSKRFGEEGNRFCSTDFMDALQTLSLNKGLFFKLLKDPNSKLIKYVENLEGAGLGIDQTLSSSSASSFSEKKLVNLTCDEPSGRKPRNFFRRRSKSMESYPFRGETDFQTANKIVILKPGPAGALSPDIGCMDNKVHSERNTSFSFTEIKRKLRHAMGKERQETSPDRPTIKHFPKHQNSNNGDKGSTGESFGWSSPNRNHFYTERFLRSSLSFKKGEPVNKLKDNSSAMVNETCQYPRFGGSSIYVEAKKHLSEMLKNGDQNPESMTRRLPKSLGRILSFPEYNGSPCISPRQYSEDVFINAQMRLSPRSLVKNDMNGLLQENNNNHPSPNMQNLESQPSIYGSNSEDKIQSLDNNDNISLRYDPENSSEIQPLSQDTVAPEVQISHSSVVEIEETTESRPQEEGRIISSSSESSNNLNPADIEKEEIREVDNTEISFQFLKEPSPCIEPSLFGEDQILSSPAVSPSRCRASTEIEDSDCAIDKIERPSPISVLEPLFVDDDISPPSTVSQPVEPRQIHFEEQSSFSDQGICMRISEGEESAFEYVEAVLLGSGLNWDEFLLRWLSTNDILDSSLFHEVELFSSRPLHDQKLLFDCANKVLKVVCDSYFGCFTGVSHVKQNIQPMPKGMDLIQEIWRRVEEHLFQSLQPHSLDQLVQTDLARSRRWMNLQSDIKHIVSEMGETIFIELVEEMVLSFVDNTSQCELAMLQAESVASEDTNL